MRGFELGGLVGLVYLAAGALGGGFGLLVGAGLAAFGAAGWAVWVAVAGGAGLAMLALAVTGGPK
jgi:hypothetical protein